jgi:elongation factor G
MEFPEPVIESRDRAEVQGRPGKDGRRAGKARGRRSVLPRVDRPESGQTIIKGMGELHLDIKVDIAARTYKVEANVGAPQVAYREKLSPSGRASTTPTRSSPAVRASSPASSSRSSRTSRVRASSSSRRSSAATVPKEYIPGVEKGLNRSWVGVLAGFPVVDFKVTLTTAPTTTSTRRRWRSKSRPAPRSRSVCRRPASKLLEPIMKVEVVTPEDYTGDVIGDLNSPPRPDPGQDMRGNANVINAMVPLANMFGYVNNLRSMSRAAPVHDAVRPLREVPANVSPKKSRRSLRRLSALISNCYERHFARHTQASKERGRNGQG